MRGLRIGFGLSLGLGLLAMSLEQCSFSLPERTLCTDLGCTPSPDLAPPPPDLSKDPNDPSMDGPFGAAQLMIQPPSGISDDLILGPSDDGVNLSTRQTSYPLVLIAPPQGVQVSQMRLYGDRLVSHGFIVGIYIVSDQSRDSNYRDTGLAYLDNLLNSSAKDHIDSTKIGLLGYQLGAKASITMTVARQTAPLIDALFLIEPTDLLSAEHIDGVGTMAQLHLPNSAEVVMLGDPRSTVSFNGNQPCIQPPQKGSTAFYNVAQSPVLDITFGGANLGDFISNYPDPVCNDASTAPQTQTQDLAVKYATAYFQWTLQSLPRAREYLHGSDFTTDAQAAGLTTQSK